MAIGLAAFYIAAPDSDFFDLFSFIRIDLRSLRLLLNGSLLYYFLSIANISMSFACGLRLFPKSGAKLSLLFFTRKFFRIFFDHRSGPKTRISILYPIRQTLKNML